jgi:hypothetical protein
LSEWSKRLDLTDWRIWNGKMASEFDDHLELCDYLNDRQKQAEFKAGLGDATFLVGKLIFRKQAPDINMEDFIKQTINELTPLYEKLV